MREGKSKKEWRLSPGGVYTVIRSEHMEQQWLNNVLEPTASASLGIGVIGV
jgi:hypothetical protein